MPEMTGSTTGQESGQHNGGGIVSKVRDTANAQLTNQKNRATEGLGNVAQAVRQTTEQLRNEHHDTLAGYVEQAANQLDRFSERLRNKDVAEMMRDVQRVARSQPALFVGGAFAVGLIAARFFKSSGNGGSDYQRWPQDRGAAQRSGWNDAYGQGGRQGGMTTGEGVRSFARGTEQGSGEYGTQGGSQPRAGSPDAPGQGGTGTTAAGTSGKTTGTASRTRRTQTERT